MTKSKVRRSIRLKEWAPLLDIELRPTHEYLAATDGSLEDKKFRLRTDANGYILPPPHEMQSFDETFVFFGDSFVESTYISEASRFVAGVQARLYEAGIKARCLNGGYSGATTLHMLMGLLGKVGRSPATSIVLIVPSNDVLALIKKGGYWCMNDRRYAPIIPVPEGGEVEAQHLDLNDIRAVLNLFVDACRRMQLKLVLATFPHRAADYETDPWLPNRFKSAANCDRMRGWCESINGVVRAIATRLGLPFVDLDAEISAKSELFYDYLHMNEAGSRRVAEIFSEFIMLQHKQPVTR